jgi:hypothetical protein
MGRTGKRFIPAAAALWLLVGLSGSAQAGSTAYVVAHDYGPNPGPDLFGQVDVTTGAFHSISTLSTGNYTVFGMGFGSDGQIYGLGFNFHNFSGPGELFSIDPTTGATTDQGALTFNPAGASGGPNGTLYALDFELSSSAALYSVNIPSSSSNFIGTVPFSSDGLVAVDSHGNLFAAGNGDGSFFEVNTMNAASQLIGNTGQGSSLYAGTFLGSTLYGFTPSDTIVSIDTTNANTTNVSTAALPTGYAVVAAAAAVPEPASLVYGLIAAISLLALDLWKRLG